MMKQRSLKSLIRRADLSQRDVARRLDTHESLISLYVSGMREVPDDQLARMAKLLGVTQADIRAVTKRPRVVEP